DGEPTKPTQLVDLVKVSLNAWQALCAKAQLHYLNQGHPQCVDSGFQNAPDSYSPSIDKYYCMVWQKAGVALRIRRKS
ncbi:MAG: hypothetical protein SNJ81_10785, partial [Cyanobacteriota bacterium]